MYIKIFETVNNIRCSPNFSRDINLICWKEGIGIQLVQSLIGRVA